MRTRFAFVVGLLICYFGGGVSAQVPPERVVRHDGPVHESDFAKDIAIDASGNVYVTGGICSRTDVIWLGCLDGAWETIKYDAAGNLLWSTSFDGPQLWWADSASFVALDGAGNVFVTGTTCLTISGDELGTYCFEFAYTTIKYDTNGNQLWVVHYGGPMNDSSLSAMVLDSEGNVYVTGSSLGVDSRYDYATIKYDTNGNQLWIARYNAANDDDAASAVALDGEGNVYVTGYSRRIGPADTATIKYDRDGNLIWVARSVEAAGFAIAVEAGNVYVTGRATIKYDGNGNELWVARYNGPGIFLVNAFAVDSSGNAYVTGAPWGAGTSPGYMTTKYDTNGNERWVARYDGLNAYGALAGAVAIALDSSGNVYVTGSSSGDYATVKYDNDGNEVWVARYDGPGNSRDEAAAIVLDAENNVYITGFSLGIDTWFDYATVKYSQTAAPEGVTPTITFGTAPTPTYLGGTFTVSATTTNTDGGLLSYRAVGGPCLVVDTSGGTFSPTGAGTCRVEASIAATANFLATSAQQLVTIAKAVATITLSDLNQAYTGSLLSPTATTTPPGLTIDWINAPRINVGFSFVTATVNDPNYQGMAKATFFVEKASAMVTLSNLTQTYTGSSLIPTATTMPPGLPIVWTNAPQTNAGSYVVTATVNDSNYEGAASGTFVINPLPSALSVTVQSPNGGERLLKGVPFTIQWTATGNAMPNPLSFDVALSLNGGSTFTNITGCTNLNGALRSCIWTPAATSSDARIRVTARDSSGAKVADKSNASFVIRRPG